MEIRRYIALIALSILLVAAFACGTTEGPAETQTPTPTSVSGVTAEQIRDQTITALDELDTCQFQMDTTMDMSFAAEGEITNLLMAVNANGALDRPTENLYMDIYMTIEIPGLEHMETSVEAYIVDDWFYMGQEFPPEPAVWTKSPLMEYEWEKQDIASQQLDLLLDVDVVLVGTEAVDGTECYVLELTPDMEKLWALMQWAGAEGGLPPDLDLEEVLADFSVMQWIAKDTYFTRKTTVNLLMVFTPESLGLTPEPYSSFVPTADMAITIIMHHINQPVTIELPPEAAEAEEMPLP
ncbi:MAG: DUF6612 family protein [Dehalococcoidia bacterium]